jgi:hypothetical protein
MLHYTALEVLALGSNRNDEIDKGVEKGDRNSLPREVQEDILIGEIVSRPEWKDMTFKLATKKISIVN